MDRNNFTAFVGKALLVTGSAARVAIAARDATGRPGEPVLIFSDRTGRQVDFDLRGSDDEIAARLPIESNSSSSPVVKKALGRPKLGVVPREVTLLPRHWDWLSDQPGGASAGIRRLVDSARKSTCERQQRQDAQAAADRFMMAMLGNEARYEEASRALYAGDRGQFLAITGPWPDDLRDYARRLAEPSFEAIEAAQILSARELLRAQFDIAWSLTRYHLENLTTAECLWRPADTCLHVNKDQQGRWRAEWPETEDYGIGPPSIAWTTWHICFWWKKALEHLEGKTDLLPADVDWPGSAVKASGVIQSLHQRWHDMLQDLPDDEFLAPSRCAWPMVGAAPATIAAWLNVELMKNAAEIGLIRFLYATKTADRPAGEA